MKKKVETLEDVRKLAEHKHYQLPRINRAAIHLKFKDGEYVVLRYGQNVKVYKPCELYYEDN